MTVKIIVVYTFMYTNIDKYALEALFHGDQFYVKCQFRVGWDAGQGLFTVGIWGWNNNSTLTTDSHASNTDIPSLDDFALT